MMSPRIQSSQAEVSPSHIALLVPSARKAADHLRKFGFQVGKEDRFEGEGTLEIYIEYGKSNSLLLMEAIGPGPYKQALEKRGPGLHHIAIDVKNVETFVDSLSGSGWLLHPRSLHTLKHKTAYLARPGFPCLIEVQEKDKFGIGPLFVKGVTLNFDAKMNGLVASLGLSNLVKSSKEVRLLLDQHDIKFQDLV